MVDQIFDENVTDGWCGENQHCFANHPAAVFACQDPDNDLSGCNIGCTPCMDWPNGFILSTGMDPDGRRWGKPLADRASGRNAYGWFGPLHSYRVEHLQEQTTFHSGRCWAFGGVECFDRDQTICDCSCGTIEKGCPEVPGEPGCTLIGEQSIYTETIASCTIFDSLAFDGLPRKIRCRLCGENRLMNFSPVSTLMGADMQQVAGTSLAGCAHNRMIPVAGHIGGGNRCDGEPQSNHYFNREQFQNLWQFMTVDYGDMRFDFSDKMIHDDVDTEMYSLKRRALARISGDSRRRQGEMYDMRILTHDFPQANNNRELDYWKKDLQITPEFFDCDEIIPIWVYDGHMKNARCSVRVTVYIKRVTVEVSLLLEHTPKSITNRVRDDREYTIPIARLKMRVELGLRNSVKNAPCVLNRPHRGDEIGLFVDGDDVEKSCDRNTVFDTDTGAPTDVDEIIMLNVDGVPVMIPTVFHWYGGRSYLTGDDVQSVWTEARENVCGNLNGYKKLACTMAANINGGIDDGDGMILRGLPTIYHPRVVTTQPKTEPTIEPNTPPLFPERHVWGGAAKISITNARSMCGDECLDG